MYPFLEVTNLATYTEFTFYANTPLINALKTIHFDSNLTRDVFFDTKMKEYEKVRYKTSQFNMVRDRLVVRVDWEFDRGPGYPGSPTEIPPGHDMIGVNYCYFYDSNSGKRTYCQVVKTEYVNDKVTNFYLSVDILMTYFQGDFTQKMGNVHIRRQHLSQETYDNNLYWLGSRDNLRVTSPQIIYHKHKPLGRTKLAADKDTTNNPGGTVWEYQEDDMWLVFQCSADLSADFGDIDEPKLKTSKGNVYNRVISPVDLYASSLEDGLGIFKGLSDYPWISQNIKNITMIPSEFIDKNDLKSVSGKTLKASGLYTFKRGTTTQIKSEILEPVYFSFDEVDSIISERSGVPQILSNEKHLYNSGYLKFYITNWAGAHLELLPEKLIGNEHNLEFKADGIIGYDNKVAIVPLKYNSNNENLTDVNSTRILVRRGEYLNAALMFDSWDTLPIMIDNYKMSLSNTAYQRKLTEESMIGNQWDNMWKGGTEDTPWWESAMRVGGSIFGGTAGAVAGGVATGGLVGGAVAGVGNGLFNGFNQMMSEKQYYRQLKAQQDQMKITKPIVTNQTLGNAFSFKQGSFGISVKLYSAPYEDIVTAVKYHKNVGYEWDRFEQPESIMSMSHVNYLEIDGEWYMDDVPTEFMQLAKEMFKQGVSFYHNPDWKLNPFNDDIMQNTRIL